MLPPRALNPFTLGAAVDREIDQPIAASSPSDLFGDGLMMAAAQRYLLSQVLSRPSRMRSRPNSYSSP
jgi:hypothetical protein